MQPPCMASERRLGRHEWRVYRDLRLRALSESPDAFGSTSERESRRSGPSGLNVWNRVPLPQPIFRWWL